jgi:phosphate transport system protein
MDWGRIVVMVTSTRSLFDKQLYHLQADIQQIAELVEVQINEATKALLNFDLDIARRVDLSDKTINQKRYDVEEQCYTLLALQQPNSHDMRRIVASVSVVTNLERMGDHAAGIARLILRMGAKMPAGLDVHEFVEMAQLSARNLNDAMRAFIDEDVESARQIIERDDEIDNRHDQIYSRLVQSMSDEQSFIECATMLLWVSHNYERYADRISNICERIVYMVTGNLHEPRPATHHDKIKAARSA